MDEPPCPCGDYTAIVLAGGRGARMGGADKGLQPFQGQPLAAHALRRLRTQTLPPVRIVISANRHAADYAALGYEVVPDATSDRFQGPLAGFLAGLRTAATPWVLTVPCDVPLLPLTLAQRLMAALQPPRPGAVMAVASSPETAPDQPPALRLQPAFCLLHVTLQADLADYLAQGGRKAGQWMARHQPLRVPFDQPADDPQAFANVNTQQELAALERATHPPA